MTKSMNDTKNSPSPAVAVGYFNSRIGGAPGAIITDHSVLFEIITAGAVYAPNGQQLCGPGWIFAHRQGQSTIHKTEPKGKYSCLTLRFADQGIMTEIDWPRAFHWSPNHSATATVANFAEEILEAYHRTNIDRTILSELALSQLRFRLAQFQQSKTAHSYPPEIAKVTEHIDRHYHQDITMSHIANIAKLSISHLHTRFKKAVGVTPHQYLIHQRMRSACHLLVATDDSIGEVAEQVGYANPESFCRAFKQFHNTTAAAYRRQHRRLYQPK